MNRDKMSKDEVFALLEQYVIEGKRCPGNESKRMPHAAIPNLARDGRLRIEISGHNYRTVTLLTGPHAGKSTKPNPSGQHAWRTVDKSGTRINGKLQDVGDGKRQQPSSLPRF